MDTPGFIIFVISVIIIFMIAWTWARARST
jgi:hypothetical protein